MLDESQASQWLSCAHSTSSRPLSFTRLASTASFESIVADGYDEQLMIDLHALVEVAGAASVRVNCQQKGSPDSR
jgi:hypothetical protein